MKLFTLIFLFLIHINFNAQNAEIEADYELQGYFKNFQEFDIDSLLNKRFKHISQINKFHTKKILQRNIDFNLTEYIYNVNINYSKNGTGLQTKSYKVNVYKEKDSIIGLINYEPYRNKTNFYFNFEKLYRIIGKHNSFYNVKTNHSDFINESTIDTKYDYVINENHEIEILDSKSIYFKSDVSNRKTFSKWLKSYNIDLQNYGASSLEHLSKKKKIKLTVDEKKLIEYINERNSILLKPIWIRYWEL